MFNKSKVEIFKNQQDPYVFKIIFSQFWKKFEAEFLDVIGT